MQGNPSMNGMMIPNMGAMSPMSGSPMSGSPMTPNSGNFPFVMDPSGMPGFNANMNPGAFVPVQNMNANRMLNMMNNGQMPQTPSGNDCTTMSPDFDANIIYNPLAQPMQSSNVANSGNPSYSPQLKMRQPQNAVPTGSYAGSPAGTNNQNQGFTPMVFPNGFSAVQTPPTMFANQI